MKKLMIMGAGIYQVPLIKKAKEMGIYTIVVSIPGSTDLHQKNEKSGCTVPRPAATV